MRTLQEWEDFIRIKWMESIGVTSPETYSWSGDDMGMLFYKAVFKYRSAREEADEKKKAARMRQSSEAAAKFVKIAVERENLDSIRNLHLAMVRVKKGHRAKADGHAKSIVGSALIGFLLDKDRLPKDRDDLRNHADGTLNDLTGVTPRNLADALVHYSLNKLIRDKTGPKPAK
jgi:hypothetical protein